MKVFGSFKRKMQRRKEEKQRWRSKLSSQNRQIRKICPTLTGLAVLLSFFLSFQTQGFYSSYKPRYLVYKDQKDCTDINITLRATLHYTTCSGLIDEYTHVHGRQNPAKPFSQIRASGNGLKHRIPCAHAQKREGFLKKNPLTHFTTNWDRCCSQGVLGS